MGAGMTNEDGFVIVIAVFGSAGGILVFFFFSSRRRHTRFDCDWSSDVCSSDLVDALRLDCEQPQFPIIHGDALSASIAAASILAKVERDRIMCEWDAVFPAYGLASHKGYSTPDRKSTRLNSSHSQISYAVFCLKKKKQLCATTCTLSTLQHIE